MAAGIWGSEDNRVFVHLDRHVCMLVSDLRKGGNVLASVRLLTVAGLIVLGEIHHFLSP